MDNPQWLTYLYVFLLSVFGGTVHNIRKIKEGLIERFSLSEWLGDVVISAFVGLMTFYLCEYSKIDGPLMAFFIGIASHQGTRGIVYIEKYFFERLKNA